MTSNLPAAWHPDSAGSTRLRWWNGQRPDLPNPLRHPAIAAALSVDTTLEQDEH